MGTPCLTRAVRDVFELGAEHEQVVFANDPATGLRAIIAIHSTALGPALGGTRFYPYSSTADAVRDVLNLSRGMSYKAALAGLDLGGGKAVIIGDPATLKTEALLRAYGRFVQSLNGRYYTACDVGTYSRGHGPHRPRVRLRHRAAPSPTAAPATARCSRRTACSRGCAPPPRRPGVRRPLAGRTVGVAGVGKVGRHLVRHLVEDGAAVVVTDVHQPAVERVRRRVPAASGGRLDRRAGRLAASTSTRRARSGQRADRRGRRGAVRAGSSAVRPTTSSPTPASRSSSRSAASSTRPTTA